MVLPNTLILGAQKAGSSWLEVRLRQHPQVFMMPELHYFDRPANYCRGLQWYERRFRGWAGQPIVAEKTPEYLSSSSRPLDKHLPNPAALIRANLPDPDLRLLCVLRDPVERAISAWNHHVQKGRIHRSTRVEEILDRPDLDRQLGILRLGLYHEHLRSYLEHFDRSRILVLFFERDVLESPHQGLRRSCQFLGIDPDYSFDSVEEPVNRFRPTTLGIRLRYHLGRAGFRAVDSFDRSVLTRLSFLERWQKRRPSPETVARLREYYRPDMDALTDIVGPLPVAWTA